MLRNTLWVVGAALACFLCGILGALSTRVLATPDTSISYADFVAILLTAVSVVLAALGIFLGVAAFIGWSSLSSGVMKRTREVLEENFSIGKPLHKLVSDKVDAIMMSGIRPIDVDAEADDTAEQELPRG